MAVGGQLAQVSMRVNGVERTLVVDTRTSLLAEPTDDAQTVRLDVPTPTWMRAPGECPGMFALESGMDELALACGVDPIELRIRNEPDLDPQTGHPFSTRNLVACLRRGRGAVRLGRA